MPSRNAPRAAQPHGWIVRANHVYPENDLREHSLGSCWCNPSDDDGIMVHNSLDRREFFERGERKFS
jgi:hypothetical protein